MATCTTRSALLSQLRDATTLRLVSFNTPLTSPLVARNAGAMPKRMPVTAVMSVTKPSTRQSSGAACAADEGRSCLP